MPEEAKVQTQLSGISVVTLGVNIVVRGVRPRAPRWGLAQGADEGVCRPHHSAEAESRLNTTTREVYQQATCYGFQSIEYFISIRL